MSLVYIYIYSKVYRYIGLYESFVVDLIYINSNDCGQINIGFPCYMDVCGDSRHSVCSRIFKKYAIYLVERGIKLIS